jgi:hypothetical protein
VTFEGFLKSDFTRAGYPEPLFGTGICFNLWHFIPFKNDTLLAKPHRRFTCGALWANECLIREQAFHKMEREGTA